jgi:hypothetical protein
MADAEAAPGAGTIEIELDGKPMEMVPTLAACIAISNIAGGLNAAVQRIYQLDFQTMKLVIQAGLALNPRQAQKLDEAIYKTGLIALSAPCVDFVNIVANGGRALPEEGEGEGEGDDLDPLVPASP